MDYSYQNSSRLVVRVRVVVPLARSVADDSPSIMSRLAPETFSSSLAQSAAPTVVENWSARETKGIKFSASAAVPKLISFFSD